MASEAKTMSLAGWARAIAIGRRPERTVRRLVLIVGLGVVAILLFTFVFRPIQINGPSMYPTFHTGQLNLLNRYAYLWHEPQRGDVVGIRYSGDHTMLVKRVVGLPGETIAFTRQGVLINGQHLDEPYLKQPPGGSAPETRHLGPDEYYVAGDNRSMSYSGATERRRIIGRVMFGGSL